MAAKQLINAVTGGQNAADVVEGKADLAPSELRLKLGMVRSNHAQFEMTVGDAWKKFVKSIDSKCKPYIEKELKQLKAEMDASNRGWYKRNQELSTKLLKLINPSA